MGHSPPPPHTNTHDIKGKFPHLGPSPCGTRHQTCMTETVHPPVAFVTCLYCGAPLRLLLTECRPRYTPGGVDPRDGAADPPRPRYMLRPPDTPNATRKACGHQPSRLGACRPDSSCTVHLCATYLSLSPGTNGTRHQARLRSTAAHFRKQQSSISPVVPWPQMTGRAPGQCPEVMIGSP